MQLYAARLRWRCPAIIACPIAAKDRPFCKECRRTPSQAHTPPPSALPPPAFALPQRLHANPWQQQQRAWQAGPAGSQQATPLRVVAPLLFGLASIYKQKARVRQASPLHELLAGSATFCMQMG
jgi:hypothetical protein